LFELADERKQLDAVAAEMVAIGQALRDTPNVAKFFANPVVKEAERQAVVERSLIATVSPLTGSFIKLLLSKNQLSELSGVTAEFARLVAKRQGKVDVDVTVARPLGAQELELVRQRISTAIQKEAVLKQKVDESILGGIIVRVGDKLIDGSVKSQLKAIEDRMLAAV
jgi:F-type H+-transporting ATPase subunit delta